MCKNGARIGMAPIAVKPRQIRLGLIQEVVAYVEVAASPLELLHVAFQIGICLARLPALLVTEDFELRFRVQIKVL